MAGFIAFVSVVLLGAAAGIAAGDGAVAGLVSGGLMSLWCAVDWKLSERERSQ